MPRLMAPQPTMTQTLLALPRQLGTFARWYRRTPDRLRRPEPAMRLGVGAVAVWFSVFFLALGIMAGRSAALVSPARPGVASAGPISGWASVGYCLAALLGPVGLALFLTRRQRIGLSVLGSMLVLGQIVTLLSLR